MTKVNTDRDAFAVSGFAGASALAATAVRSDPVPDAAVSTAALGTDPPAATAVRAGPPAAATPGTASPVQDPPGPAPAQEAYFASTRSTTSAVPGTGLETPELKYMRQTRNATVFIAIVVGIFTALAVIGVIYTAVTVSKLNSEVNGFNNGVNSSLNSNCASQGGTNPDC